ncbi:hypothetical protein D9M68_1002020 [compost metagenome]
MSGSHPMGNRTHRQLTLRVRMQNQDRAGLGGFVATGSPAKSCVAYESARGGGDTTRNAKEVSTGNADTPITGLSTPSWAPC